MQIGAAGTGIKVKWWPMQHSANSPVTFILDDDAAPGIRKVAAKVAQDFGNITGTVPQVEVSGLAGLDTAGPKVIVGEIGKSKLIDDAVAKGIIDGDALQGKCQVYQIAQADDNTWVIAGIDRLGVIYGLYALSEYAGVSPLHYWGDVAPVKKDAIEFGSDLITISRQPSIKYRGFFINDEWPCFGTWTYKHFGGFTAEMYDHVFDLLLRLKGNYLWPAMWASSFALDGPGNLNEVLADEYGIAIGASHHEPLLRAGEEFKKFKGPDSPYGEEWDYIANREGMHKFWRDAMERSGHLNKIIMVGIRGEADSEILGTEAGMKANVDLLRDAINAQRKIIAETDKTQIHNPQMLALYKEVEEFYYGDKKTPGLRADLSTWANATADGQPPVTLMFCEDNFGFMRSLPENDAERAHAGMYYHLDYHGGPISYEWMPSIAFERIHDQMSLAYDYGIKDVWVVNVGDLKFNEVPLSFFMAMAYDMDKYGNHNGAAVGEYTTQWVAKTFPAASAQAQAQIGELIHAFIRLNGARRPEALNENVYHAAHYLEADRILAKVDHILELDQQIEKQLDPQTLIAYRSLLGIPARASANLNAMMLNAAKNKHFAEQGKPIANAYADLVTKAINTDNAIIEEIKNFQGGKWEGHEKEAHVGFTTWNEDGSRYPLRLTVEPYEEPRMLVSRADEKKYGFKTYWKPMQIIVDDFEFANETEVLLEIANDGKGEFEFEIEGAQNAPWLSIETPSAADPHGRLETTASGSLKGKVEYQTPIVLHCDRSMLTEQKETVTLQIKATKAMVEVVVSAKLAPGEAGTKEAGTLPPHTYLAGPGNIVAINANHFAETNPGQGGESWEIINLGGRDGDAIRVFPTTASFSPKPAGATSAAPSVTYRALITEPGEYDVEVWQVPTGAVVRGTPLEFSLDVKMHDAATSSFSGTVTAVPDDVNGGYPDEPRWAGPVLDNIRKTTQKVKLDQGVADITIGAIQPNLMLERVLIYPANHPPKKSYLGPLESPIAQ